LARPLAIFASIPPNHVCNPKWDHISGIIPVEYDKPNENWPDLDWTGDIIEDNGPTEYNFERPKYLWAHPLVHDPVNGESYVFIRQWEVGNPGEGFNGQTIPAENLVLLITYAADNEYAMALVVGCAEQPELSLSPIGANKDIPSSSNSWRNVKTYLYYLDLTKVSPGTTINLISEVINSPQRPNGIVETNPAMFTWVMQVYDYPH
jgi:hypothetical protein